MAHIESQPYAAAPGERIVAVDHTTTRTGLHSRVSWGAVFAGVVIATALQLVLTVLGAAIGLTALDGEDSGKAFGIGAGLWALLVPLITLFVGGMTAGRLANVREKGDAFLHGALVWGVSLLLAAWLLGTGASRLIGSTLNLAGNVAGGAANAAGQVASRSDVNAADVQGADDRLRQEAAQRGVTEGEAQQRADSLRQQAGQVADKAQGVAAGGAWLALLALGLSLAAAALGATRAVPKHHATVTTTTTHRPATA
jgi:hypothetical protein